jgi:hypothetical protein
MAMKIYCTTYCNHGHRVSDGKPVDHECITIPPKALQAEIDGDFEKAIDIMEKRGKNRR